jgi:hypothetical protein
MSTEESLSIVQDPDMSSAGEVEGAANSSAVVAEGVFPVSAYKYE